MTILNYRPADDQFWIGCTYEEAEEMMLPLMDRDRILKYHELKRAYRCVLKNEDYIKSLRKCYGINVVPEAFFNISRDLKVCFPEIPLFPFAGQWNSWNPFVDCDHVEIQDLSELKELKVTLKGEPIEHKKSPDAELL